MEFKIDTKETYAIITPVYAAIDANLTAALAKKCTELADSGKNNYIIDLHHCEDADNTSFGDLLQLHEDCYNNSRSLVFTNIGDRLMDAVKDTELDLALNITPKLIEAVDIVSMEILERDLFNEEE